MTPEMVIFGIVILPVVLLTLLRANAAIVFLSLCLGSVLVQFVGTDAASVGSNIFSGNANVTKHTMSVALLVLPALFTTIFMIRSVRGKGRLLINLLPALGVGFVGLFLAVPIVSPGLRGSITHTSLWHNIQPAEELAVVVAAIISLFSLWLMRPKATSTDKHGKHHAH